MRATRKRNANRKGFARPSLSRKRETELVRRWQRDRDREAREELVRILSPRAKAIALRYYSNHVSREDLVAEGMVGLLVGIDRYDPSRRVRLMTYASHWIRAHVVKAVLKGWARGKTGTGVSRSRIFFKIRRQTARHRSLHGMTRSIMSNVITGVSEGFVKALEIQGVGYRANMEGSTLVMTLGYSHPVKYEKPSDVSIEVKDQRIVEVSGIDKQRVGQVAAIIRDFKRPEPYKGTGVRYVGENVRRKEGKAGA